MVIDRARYMLVLLILFPILDYVNPIGNHPPVMPPVIPTMMAGVGQRQG
jgi:hypothetical protein